jgi:hypothetical protein
VTSFLEDNSHYASELAMEIHHQIYLQSTLSSSESQANTTTAIQLSYSSLQMAKYLDQLMQLCCLMFQDVPPMPPSNASREAARRSSVVRHNHPTSSTNHSLALQMDIERLFAAKIRVFEEIPSDCASEFLMNTVIKVSERESG